MAHTYARDISSALTQNTYLPEELVDEVSLENANFVSNDQLRSLLEGTDATPSEVEEFVRINEESRLSALAIVPAARLPRYRAGEIPEPENVRGGKR